MDTEEESHPTSIFLKDILQRQQLSVTTSHKRRSYDTEFLQNFKQTVPEEKEKVAIPRYMYRSNPASWITGRIVHKQAWGSRYHDQINADLDCGYPKCKLKPNSPYHVLVECPQFSDERNTLNWSLLGLFTQLDSHTMVGDYSNSKIRPKDIAVAEDRISKYIEGVAKQKPFTYCAWTKFSEDLE